MKRIAYLLFFLLLAPAYAQNEGQEEFLRYLRNNNAGGSAAVWERLVTVQGSPAFWEFANGPGQKSMVNLAYGLTRAFSSLGAAWGLGDANETLGQMNRDATAPPYLAVVDGYKGKMSININFEPFVPEKGKEQIENIYTMTTTMADQAFLKPRGGKLIMNCSFNPKAKNFVGKVSKDGNTYDLVWPIYAGFMSNWNYEEVFKKGLK